MKRPRDYSLLQVDRAAAAVQSPSGIVTGCGIAGLRAVVQEAAGHPQHRRAVLGAAHAPRPRLGPPLLRGRPGRREGPPHGGLVG